MNHRPEDDDLSTLLPVDDDHLARLHDALVRRAEADATLDIGYRTIDSPLGVLLLAATPRGLVRVAYEREGLDEVLQALAERISPRILRSARRLDEPAREIDEFLTGRRHGFDLPLDRSLSHGFRGQVHHHLGGIPYGHVVSYKDVATQLGSPRAVRAVGTACATNPLPIVVPCHRVLRSDGSLGGYVGGLAAKTTLLTLEGHA